MLQIAALTTLDHAMLIATKHTRIRANCVSLELGLVSPGSCSLFYINYIKQQLKEMTGEYQKCFCPNCQGCLRARRTVYRHQKLFGSWSCEEVEAGSQVIKPTKFADENSDIKGMYNS